MVPSYHTSDEQQPSFDGDCPKSVTVRSEFASTSQIVDFDEPTATDNSGEVSVKRWVVEMISRLSVSALSD